MTKVDEFDDKNFKYHNKKTIKIKSNNLEQIYNKGIAHKTGINLKQICDKILIILHSYKNARQNTSQVLGMQKYIQILYWWDHKGNLTLLVTHQITPLSARLSTGQKVICCSTLWFVYSILEYTIQGSDLKKKKGCA